MDNQITTNKTWDSIVEQVSNLINLRQQYANELVEYVKSRLNKLFKYIPNQKAEISVDIDNLNIHKGLYNFDEIRIECLEFDYDIDVIVYVDRTLYEAMDELGIEWDDDYWEEARKLFPNTFVYFDEIERIEYAKNIICTVKGKEYKD